tara:strand:+ start:371 stop:508 length:138 start_codon:yes stop_codon:yes gene_type:complete
MSKKEIPPLYDKDRMEYFREFHQVVAPLIVLKKYDEEEDNVTNKL